MNLKNYTSGVAVETTIARIEMKLAAMGVTHVNKMFSPKGQVVSLVFGIPNGNKVHAIKIPANVQACFDAMWKDHCCRVSTPRESSKATIFAQAERTAWRLVQEWIEVQASMIYMKQAEAMQVFLPYVWDGQQTYFEAMKSGGFKALPEKAS